jgi:nucleotide-binding universal stress UspA family protein
MIKKILVATDGGTPAVRAVEVAVQMAGQLSANLGMLHVVDEARAFVPDLGILDDVVIAELRREGIEALTQACALVPPEITVKRILVDGDPAEAILETAQSWGADLIVMGSDSRGRLAHFLLGSTADSVIRKAPCPVVSVRANVGAAPAKTDAKREPAGGTVARH